MSSTTDPLSTFRIQVDGEPVYRCTWAAIEKANTGDEDGQRALEQIAALAPGESCMIGGGASTLFRVTRVKEGDE